MRPNDRDEQIAAVDSQLRRTLTRVCSNVWFGVTLEEALGVSASLIIHPNAPRSSHETPRCTTVPGESNLASAAFLDLRR
jgi:hypothetical protein